MKFSVAADIRNAITYPNFADHRFTRFRMARGRILHFPLTLDVSAYNIDVGGRTNDTVHNAFGSEGIKELKLSQHQ